MTKKISASSQARGRKERVLRFCLRKRPCCYITIAEIISLIVLTSLFVLLLILVIAEKRTIENFDRDDVTFERMGNHTLFAHCNYLEPNEFDMTFCKYRIDVEAYAWRHYKLDSSEDDRTCMDLYEQMECHENVLTTITKKWEPRVIQQCAGLNKVPMPHAKSNESAIVIAPLFSSNDQLTQHLNKVVLAQEIFLQCPQCEVRSRQFKMHEACVVKLNTTKKGWPSFAEECDDVVSIIHASNNCQPP